MCRHHVQEAITVRFHPLARATLPSTTAMLALALASMGAADARPVVPHQVAASHRVVHAHHRHAAASRAAVPYGYLDSVPEDPRYGYEEAPYDPNYHGPGAEIFNATKALAQSPQADLLHELEPDAKVSATGVVVGGGLSGQ